MKRVAKIVVAVLGVALVGVTAAQANDGWGSDLNCGPSRGYSSRSYDSFGGYGRSSYGGYGYGGYSQGGYGHGWSGSSYYDYHPTQIQIQRGHIDVQPGHYDRHSSRHWGW